MAAANVRFLRADQLVDTSTVAPWPALAASRALRDLAFRARVAQARAIDEARDFRRRQGLAGRRTQDASHDPLVAAPLIGSDAAKSRADEPVLVVVERQDVGPLVALDGEKLDVDGPCSYIHFRKSAVLSSTLR